MSGEIKQEVDRVESGRVIMIGVTALVIFALGIVWAIWIQRESIGTIRSYTPEQVPEGRKDEIGMVFQPAFEYGNFAEKTTKKALWRLDHYGWSDEQAKKAHIPIDRAIDEYVAESMKNGGKL